MASECAAFELELADAALDAVAAAHLEGCAECRQRVEAHQAMWAAVKALPRLQAAPSVRAAVLAAAVHPVAAPAPSAATARDVRSQVLEAARQAAAGHPPASLERFREVPAAATAPQVERPAVKRPAPRLRLVAALAAVVLLAVAVWLARGEEAVEEQPAPPPPQIALPQPEAAPSPAAPAPAAPAPAPIVAPAPRTPLLAVVCSCFRAEQVKARDAFLAANPGARAMRPDDAALEAATQVFAIGGDGLDAALALPRTVPITYALVPWTYQRPKDRNAVEVGLPTRKQLDEIRQRLPGLRRVAVVVNPTMSLGELDQVSEEILRVAPPKPERPIDFGNLRGLTGVDAVWAIGVDGPVLDAVALAAQRDHLPMVVSSTDETGFGSMLSFVPISVPVAIVKPPDESSSIPADNGRSRARTLARLALSGRPDVVGTLCQAVEDRDSMIRLAAIAGLGSLGQANGLVCLNAHRDAVPLVQEQAALAIALLHNGPRWRVRYRVTGDGLIPAELELAQTSFKQSLERWGITPETEQEGTPLANVLHLHLTSIGGGMANARILARAPDGVLLDNWNVATNGAMFSGPVERLVPRVVLVIAEDLGWRRP